MPTTPRYQKVRRTGSTRPRRGAGILDLNVQTEAACNGTAQRAFSRYQ
ncbi:hypothetical protein [Hydrogenophaga sp.]|nr:hypothetical protein [Hydrogenophaga sp.]MDO8906345.1 hypothetical protein [Hydrogenophaga sp.]